MGSMTEQERTHAPYRRNGTGQVAVLLVHGIVGTPRHFDPFLPLIPQQMTVWNLLLDGHGKTVRDFSRTSMKKWEQQVADAVAELAGTHDEVWIVAHSMGTLFAIEQAIAQPKVTKLFLLAAPLQILVRWRMIVNASKVYFGTIDPAKPSEAATAASLGMTADKNLFHYLGWIPRYLELFSKIRKTRRSLSQLQTPCVVFQSAKDEMVSPAAAKLLEPISCVRLTVLERSGHYYYAPEELARLREAFREFIN